MAVDQQVSAKAIEAVAEAIAWALNREIVPVVRRLREWVNGSSFSVAFGDGVATTFVITHSMGTRDLVPVVRITATHEVVATPLITFTSVDEVTIDTFPVIPAVDEFTLVLKR